MTVFVPNARIVDLAQAMAGVYGSEHLEEHALYRIPMVPFFFTKLAFTGVGIAKAMVDEFVELAARRGILYTPYEKQSEAPIAHLQVGEATAKIEAAELLLRKCVQVLEQAAIDGSAVSLPVRTELRRNTGFANKLTMEAVDMLAGAAGASFAFEGHPLNRLWRDARVASLHAGINPTWAFELYGRVRFGLDPGSPMV
jgi:3-hydroxy-9,10-secoandrosta-1,3,5(10)-triene-9,17-dione monooxygenase